MTTETAPQPDTPPRRRRRWPWIVGGGLVVLIVALGIVRASVGDHLDAATTYASWKLDLTTEQDRHLDALAAELRSLRQDMRTQGRDARTQAARLVAAETFDPAAAQALADSMVARAETHLPALLDRFAALHASLTPEQRKTLAQRIDRDRP